jgi:hypothetical protein
MAKIKKGSRRIVLLAAFVSVMSAAGGLLGAVTGAVVVLLMKSMFNTTTGIAEFMLTMVVLGAGMLCVLGLMLTVERPHRMFVRAGISGPAAAPVAVVQGTEGQ